MIFATKLIQLGFSLYYNNILYVTISKYELEKLVKQQPQIKQQRKNYNIF